MLGSEVGLERLRAGSVELTIDARGGGLPRIIHWGPDLGELTPPDLERLAMAAVPPVTSYVLDDPVPVAVLPEHALGLVGLPRGDRASR